MQKNLYCIVDRVTKDRMTEDRVTQTENFGFKILETKPGIPSPLHDADLLEIHR